VIKIPTYDYACEKCHIIKEIRHKMSENPEIICEECGSIMKKLISAPSFILKGEGWYISDHPSKSRKEGIESEKKSKEESTGKSDNKDKAVKEIKE